MNMATYRPVRILFSKTGPAVYISHLDLNRCMLRAVRRAELPLWYTEGFNPHPYITFALPLSLGQASVSEPMDIRIHGEMAFAEIHRRLAAVMPAGIEILEVTHPEDEFGAIAFADYDIRAEFADENSAADYTREARRLIAEGNLTAEKLGKKGHRKVMKTIRLSDLIASADLCPDGCEVLLTLHVAAGSTANLNPALLITALEKETGITAHTTRITRTRLLKADGSDFC